MSNIYSIAIALAIIVILFLVSFILIRYKRIGLLKNYYRFGFNQRTLADGTYNIRWQLTYKSLDNPKQAIKSPELLYIFLENTQHPKLSCIISCTTEELKKNTEQAQFFSILCQSYHIKIKDGKIKDKD